MEQYLERVGRSALFSGMTAEEVSQVLGCLEAAVERYGKNQFVLRSGSVVRRVGMVLSGRVYVVREDFWGNRDILTQVIPGQLFAEAYACCPGRTL